MDERAKRLTVADVVQHVGGTLRGSGDVQINGVNSIADATAEELTFISRAAFASQWKDSKAGAALVTNGLDPFASGGTDDGRPLIYVPDAEHAMIRMLELFQVPEHVPEFGIHPSAVVHTSATLGQQVRIGAHVSIDARAQIGDGVVLHAGVRLYANSAVGDGSVCHANVVIREGCKIGRGVILHQNVSIGADGFGYRPGPHGAGLVKIPHIGNVIIHDAVEIGANSCVDRGKFGATIIGAGTKIDNLCQIAHNCRIGRSCVIAGMTGIGGSTSVGDGAQIAGKVGICDHLRIGNGVKIGAQSCVTRDMPDRAVWLGYPADQATAVLRQWAAIRKLPDLLRRLTQRDSA